MRRPLKVDDPSKDFRPVHDKCETEDSVPSHQLSPLLDRPLTSLFLEYYGRVPKSDTVERRREEVDLDRPSLFSDVSSILGSSGP